MSESRKVVQLSRRRRDRGDGGNGGDGTIEDRLVRLETQIEQAATKEDIGEVKLLIVQQEASLQRWLIGVLLAALGTTTLALVRIFSN